MKLHYAKISRQAVSTNLLHFPRRKYLVIFIAVILLINCILQIQTSFDTEKILVDKSTLYDEVTDFLINTTNCRIPNIDPFNDDIIAFLNDEDQIRCSKNDILSYIEKRDDFVTLHINKSVLHEYSFLSVWCCYSNITRVNFDIKVDNQISFTKCQQFQDSVNITYPYVKVKCKNVLRTVYENVHATVLPLPKSTVLRKKQQSRKPPKYSVLLLGIDSMSKFNFKRNMPVTYKYVENNMYNFKGYNKVGENTFPNLMAILTGHSPEQLQILCNKTVKLNTCNFIWDTFKNHGYTTAYAEDELGISTFNYDRPGFKEEPTDYYYHPYKIAAEEIGVITHHHMNYCSGPERAGQRILNAAKDFAISLKEVPSFGLFWLNSFSHDDMNMPELMDEALFTLLSDTTFNSALNNTFLIFFSDHGYRMGGYRLTQSGWLDERLPFIYIKVPNTFKTNFPVYFKNLLINLDRLTVPYDFFNTLQKILQIGNSSYKATTSAGCPICGSFFSEQPENRTCQDASVPIHYCTCQDHSYVNLNNPVIRLASNFIIKKVNSILKHDPNGYKCFEYFFSKIHSASLLDTKSKSNQRENYLVMVETVPTAMFEATVETFMEKGERIFNLLGDISRIDRYHEVTTCFPKSEYKKYCYCKGLFERLINIF